MLSKIISVAFFISFPSSSSVIECGGIMNPPDFDGLILAINRRKKLKNITCVVAYGKQHTVCCIQVRLPATAGNRQLLFVKQLLQKCKKYAVELVQMKAKFSPQLKIKNLLRKLFDISQHIAFPCQGLGLILCTSMKYYFSIPLLCQDFLYQVFLFLSKGFRYPLCLLSSACISFCGSIYFVHKGTKGRM